MTLKQSVPIIAATAPSKPQDSGCRTLLICYLRATDKCASLACMLLSDKLGVMQEHEVNMHLIRLETTKLEVMV